MTIQVSDVVRYKKDPSFRRYVVDSGNPKDGYRIVLIGEFKKSDKDFEYEIPEWAKVYDVKEEDLVLFAKSEDYDWS